jgi:hypothetical protein
VPVTALSIQPYIQQAYDHAGINEAAWQPEKGYKHNKELLYKIYTYYQNLYFTNPDKFLWAGLARLTGGQVLYGMNNIVKIAKDPCVLTQKIGAVAKAIFERMAWQHELFNTDPELLFELLRADTSQRPTYPYEDCWKLVMKNDAQSISLGNKMLLENEQHSTIQPYYEEIKLDKYSARYFMLTRFVMRNIHKHHRRFILCHPLGDVTVFRDRWRWIEGSKGMWRTWVDMDTKERDRLVGLSNDDVIAHRW